jgi:cysteine desulfurase/selenocysteine lyase
MNLDSVREQFPVLRDKVFLDAACVSLAPRCAVEAVQSFLDLALLCPGRSSTLHHLAMDEMRSRARTEAAQLIHAAEAEIALVESTSHGLTIAATAIPLEPGDRVLLCDLEFIEVALPWRHLESTRGVAMDMVSTRGGCISVSDIEAAITQRTRVLAISSVQWSNGFRCDLDGLSRLCSERGIWLVVDAIQQLGAMPVDVRSTHVDFLACGGHKWLNSPFGQGFLYISESALPRLQAPVPGYLSLEDPPGGWGAYFETPSITPLHPHQLARAARRYETGGTSNYAGAIALGASLNLIQQLGTEAIAAHILRLTEHLLAGLDRLGIEIGTPREPAHRSGIVSFSMGSVSRNAALVEYLLDHRVLVSLRYTSGIGGVRVSCHFYNTAEDLDHLLERTAEFTRGRVDVAESAMPGSKSTP